MHHPVFHQLCDSFRAASFHSTAYSHIHGLSSVPVTVALTFSVSVIRQVSFCIYDRLLTGRAGSLADLGSWQPACK